MALHTQSAGNTRDQTSNFQAPTAGGSVGVPAVRLEGVTKQFGDDAVGRRVARSIPGSAGVFPVVAVDNINLDVHDGKVILSGVVHSWAERQSVVGAAKGTPGVRSVDDRLSVEP